MAAMGGLGGTGSLTTDWSPLADYITWATNSATTNTTSDVWTSTGTSITGNQHLIIPPELLSRRKHRDADYSRMLPATFLAKITAEETTWVTIHKGRKKTKDKDKNYKGRKARVIHINTPIEFHVAPGKTDIDQDGGEQYYPIGKDMFDCLLQGLVDLELPDRWYGQIHLPDGAYVRVEKDQSYSIVDKYAKVTYRANRIRDFNRYINASDLIEEFIHFLMSEGVPPALMLKIPIEVFINFLVLRAAEVDREPVPSDVKIADHPALPKPSSNPRCNHCGRFITSEKHVHGINFCNEQHLLLFSRKKGVTL